MCIFCKIVNHEIPAYVIHETPNTIAFLDISQATIGHTLVIPKKHYDNIFALDSEISAELFQNVCYTTKLLKEKLNFNDVNLLNNNGILAGQVVMHYHIHIIPRYSSEEISFNFTAHEPDFKQLTILHQKIIDNK